MVIKVQCTPEAHLEIFTETKRLGFKSMGAYLLSLREQPTPSKEIYNPVTNSYYEVRTEDTPRGNKGSIIGKSKKSTSKTITVSDSDMEALNNGFAVNSDVDYIAPSKCSQCPNEIDIKKDKYLITDTGAICAKCIKYAQDEIKKSPKKAKTAGGTKKDLDNLGYPKSKSLR